MASDKKRLEQVEERVKQELSRNPLWKKTVIGRWLCPYCGMLAAKAKGQTAVECVRDHLIQSCPAWRGFQGQYIALKTLQNKTVAILMKHCLTSEPGWKIFDEHGQWYCPYCAQAQAVPPGPSTERAARLKRQIKEHLYHCQKFDWGSGKPVPMEAMRRIVDRANMIKRLQPQVKKVLVEDQRWQAMAVDGSWICPFCEERIKNIDVSTQFLRCETAPNLVANHLLRYCTVYQKLQVRGKDGSLKPPEDLLKVTDMIQEHRQSWSETPKLSSWEKPKRPATSAPVGKSSGKDPSKKLASEGFELSVKVSDDQKTTWDAASAEEGEPVTSDTEVRRARATKSDSEVSEVVVAEFMEEQEAVSDIPQAVGEPGSGEALVDHKTRIQEQAFARSRRHLLEMTCQIPKLRGCEFGAMFKPSENLDGDFFYVFDLGHGRHAIAAWEISRTGMEMVPINQHFLERLSSILEQETRPGNVLSQLNDHIFNSTDNETYVSILLIVLDTAAKEIVLANAGFQPLIVYNQFRTPNLTEVRTNGIVLGSDEGALFKTLLQEYTMPLHQQDLLVLFSQGVVEFQDQTGRTFGIEGFKGLIEEYGRQDPSYFLSMVEAEYKRMSGDEPYPHDLTIVSFKQM